MLIFLVKDHSNIGYYAKESRLVAVEVIELYIVQSLVAHKGRDLRNLYYSCKIISKYFVIHVK